LLAAWFLGHPLYSQQTVQQAGKDVPASAVGSPGQAASAAIQPTQQEILQELDAMKQRIAQLEAEL
jgi:hypothetical protein